MDNELFCTVVSLVPVDLREEKPGLVPPRFCIPASDGKHPQVLHIGTATHFVYLDEARGSLPVRNPPDWVAKSVVDDFISAQLRISEVAKPGLFFVAGKWSSVEIQAKFKVQLEQAWIMQQNWMMEVCKLADDDWNKFHQHNVVSDTQRKFAQMLGWRVEEHEWMSPRTTLQSTMCPSCGKLAPLNAVVCQECKCILDAEKYKELKFAN